MQLFLYDLSSINNRYNTKLINGDFMMENKDILMMLDTRITAAKLEGNFTEEICMKAIKNKILYLIEQINLYRRKENE